jgi:hypothetical protein
MNYSNIFIHGYKIIFWKIAEKYNFGYAAIENVSHNYIIINNIMLKTKPHVISPTAYFFYNFAYNRFKPEKTLIINYFNKHQMRAMTKELLRGFYHKIRKKLGTEYIQKTITKLGIDKIDDFSDEMYDYFKTNPEQISTNALNVNKYEDIKNYIFTKINNNEETKNDIILNINEKINQNQIDIDKKGHLSLTKNYYIILFIMTYLKMQYEIYIDFIHKNKSINKKMNIELLNKMVVNLQETMTKIITEFKLLESEKPQIQNNLKSHYDTLESEYRVFEKELHTVKEKANELVKNPTQNGGKSRRKREKNEGKYTRKGNRKI